MSCSKLCYVSKAEAMAALRRMKKGPSRGIGRLGVYQCWDSQHSGMWHIGHRLWRKLGGSSK